MVGRPNVGKSTLFNRLTKTRDALVADYAGLTRDRQYGFGKVGPRPYLVVDTGGLAGASDGIESLRQEQALAAIDEADVVVFLADARDGLLAGDEEIAGFARGSSCARHHQGRGLRQRNGGRGLPCFGVG